MGEEWSSWDHDLGELQEKKDIQNCKSFSQKKESVSVFAIYTPVLNEIDQL